MVDLVRELEGKAAIITGSARNIGPAAALELARAGASYISGQTSHCNGAALCPH